MTSKFRFFTLRVLIISSFILANCSAGQIGTMVTSTPTISAVIPKVSADTGALKVTLISTITEKPLSNALIRCANMLKMTGSIEGAYVPELNSSTSPWGNTDADGTVVISNMKPGKYALAYVFPIGMPELIKVEGKDTDFSFDIEAGKVLDLGVLQVTVNPDKMQ